MPIRPGTTYHISRCTVGRHRWLTPSKKLDQLFKYLLAVAAERYEVEIHAAVCMSTHYHGVVTDTLGCVPAFEQWLNARLATATNVLIGRTDTFWGTRVLSRQVITNAEVARGKLIYVLNNPTAAGLVAHGRDWPGTRTTPEQMLDRIRGRGVVIERPDFYFDATGERLPKEATLRLTVPRLLLEEVEREEAEGERLWVPVRRADARGEGAEVRGGDGEEVAPQVARGEIEAQVGGSEAGPQVALGVAPVDEVEEELRPPDGAELVARGEAKHEEGEVAEGDSDGAVEEASVEEASLLTRAKRLATKVVARIARCVHEAEEEAAAELREAGRHFIGRRAVLRQSKNKRSTTPERRGSKEMRVPIFLTSSREAREELLEALGEWRARYQKARRALLSLVHGPELPGGGSSSGGEAVILPVFPEGTYKLRLQMNVPCHPPP